MITVVSPSKRNPWPETPVTCLNKPVMGSLMPLTLSCAVWPLLSSKSHSAMAPEFCARVNTGIQITRQIDKKRRRFIAGTFLEAGTDEEWTNQSRNNFEPRKPFPSSLITQRNKTLQDSFPESHFVHRRKASCCSRCPSRSPFCSQQPRCTLANRNRS